MISTIHKHTGDWKWWGGNSACFHQRRSLYEADLSRGKNEMKDQAMRIFAEKNVPGRGNCKCKGPEVGAGLRSSAKISSWNASSDRLKVKRWSQRSSTCRLQMWSLCCEVWKGNWNLILWDEKPLEGFDQKKDKILYTKTKGSLWLLCEE